MTEPDLLSSAEARIRQHRTREVQLRILDPQQRPLKRLKCRLRLVRHEFKLGANAFRLFSVEDRTLQEAYDERFVALLNYATLPFYWSSYEPRRDDTQEARLGRMADWCRSHGVAAKGHPLVWHEAFPEWAAAQTDDDVLERLQARVRRIVSRSRGQIGIWDVVNEATVSHNFDNAVGRWIKARGAASCVAESLQWAYESNPDATLLYNDFNVSPDFETLVGGLLSARAPVHTIGVQSHMHKGTWPVERVWEVCETYARFGLPLHFTEATVLSGPLKAPDDNDWHKRRDDWPTTPDGEARQLDYASKFYTILFSHPAVHAVTWWDFSDNGSWQGAPAGLIRGDMTPKPIYDWLIDAYTKRWTTDEETVTDAVGRARLRGFLGDYEAVATTESGQVLRGDLSLRGGDAPELTVTLA